MKLILNKPRKKRFNRVLGVGVGMGMLLIVFSTLAFATVAPGLPMLTSMAVANNPGLAALKSQADAATARITGGSVPPDPEIMLESMNNPLGSVMDPGTRGFELSYSQTIPYPGKLDASGERQRVEADVAREAYAMRLAEIKKDVALSYYRIAVIDVSLGIMDKKQKQLEAMGKVVLAEYTNNKAPQSQYVRINVMKSMVKTEILAMETDRARMMAELVALLGGAVPKDVAFQQTEKTFLIIPTENDMITAALNHFPEILMKRAMERRMAAEARQMQLEAAPDFTLRGTLSSMSNGDRTFSLGVSFPVPLYLKQKQIPNANAASLMSEAAIKDRQDTENRITQEIKARYISLTKANETLIQYKSTVQRSSELALEVALKEYPAKRIGFNELIEAFQTVYDVALQIEKTRLILQEEQVYLDFYTANMLRWEGKS